MYREPYTVTINRHNDIVKLCCRNANRFILEEAFGETTILEPWFCHHETVLCAVVSVSVYVGTPLGLVQNKAIAD